MEQEAQVRANTMVQKLLANCDRRSSSSSKTNSHDKQVGLEQWRVRDLYGVATESNTLQEALDHITTIN